MLKTIPAARVRAGSNDRTVFDPDALAELAANIRDNGLTQPITVRPLAGASLFEIVAGERRFRAVTTVLGWTELVVGRDVVIRELSDEQASAIMLSENMGRKDLDPVDEALAYEKRAQEFGWGNQEIAVKAGVSVWRVEQRRRLSQVRPDILALVRVGQFPIGHAAHLADLDTNRQMLAARPMIEGRRLTVGEFRQVVDRLLAEQQQETLFALGQVVVMPEPEINGPQPEIPFNKKIPRLPSGSSTGAALLNYVRVLQDNGLDYEAGVIGTALTGLLRHGLARLPNSPRPTRPS